MKEFIFVGTFAAVACVVIYNKFFKDRDPLKSKLHDDEKISSTSNAEGEICVEYTKRNIKLLEIFSRKENINWQTTLENFRKKASVLRLEKLEKKKLNKKWEQHKAGTQLQ